MVISTIYITIQQLVQHFVGGSKDLVVCNAVISACASALQWPYALHLVCHYMAGDEASPCDMTLGFTRSHFRM